MSETTFTRALDFMKKYWYAIALIIIIMIAIWYRMGIINSFIIPTYGNTMYHVGIERETILTQHYPDYELSYGGGFPHFYVPAYRLLISSMSIVSGIDPMVMSGLMTITIAVFILLAMFIVAYRLSNNPYVALFAAFFFIISPELTIFTIRPLPEILGLFMVPLTLYFVIREDWAMAIVGSIITALTHQMTLLSLVAIMAMYVVFQLIYAAMVSKNYRKALMCVLPIVAACGTYAIWQIYSLGTLNIFNIAQVVNREGNPVTLALFLRTGIFVLIFLVLGLYYLYLEKRGNKRQENGNEQKQEVMQAEKMQYLPAFTIDGKLLVLAWIVVTALLTKNEVFGISIFMDRFFTFFVQIAVIVAGIGMYALLYWMEFGPLKVKPE